MRFAIHFLADFLLNLREFLKDIIIVIIYLSINEVIGMIHVAMPTNRY